MIPRYDGLVPAIRGPTSSSSPASATTSAAASKRVPTTITRYVLQPTLTDTAASALPTESRTDGLSQYAKERRLYTFLPSADVPIPPGELRVAARFFGGSDDQDDLFDDQHGEDGLDSEEDARDGGAVAASASPSPPATATSINGRQRFKRRRRGKEPMRLEYQGRIPAEKINSGDGASFGGVAKLASTPSVEYSHLTCVMVQLPSDWLRPASAHEADGAKNASSSASDHRLVRSTVLTRPILQLWGERKEAPPNAMAVHAGDEGGISKSWYADQPTRINKKDYKTMDEVDVEMHKPTNWSDDDGGGEGDDTGKDPVAARARKRAKEEAKSQSVNAFLAGARNALRHQREGTEDVDVGDAVKKAAPQQPPLFPSLASEVSSARAGAQTAEAEPVKVNEAKNSAAEKPRSIKLVVTSGALPVPTAAAAASLTTTSQPVAPAKDLESAPTPADASVTLSSLAATVVTAMRQAEARAAAPLMELQKRILKQLPEFAVMNQKMKAASTKKEAVAWFQSCQRDLRVWLQGHGHSIASDGTVTFGSAL